MTDPAPDIDRDVRTAWNTSAPVEQWLVEVNAADGYVIATNEKDRSFLRVPVLVGDSIEFGTPVPVVPGFIEAPVAASRVVFASRAESRPEVAASTATVLDSPAPPDPRPPAEPIPPAGPPPTEEPQTPPQPGGVPVPPTTPGAEPDRSEPEKEADPVSSTLSTDVRSRLGLPDDADDTAVVAALDALKSKVDTPTPDPAQVAASAAAVEERDELKKEVAILASKVTEVTTELAATKAAKAVTVKAAVLDEAQKLGKFTPAERAQWEADYDESPTVTTRTLARIAAGAAVPVQASGYTGGADEVGIDDEYEAFCRTLDGPYATTKKEA